MKKNVIVVFGSKTCEHDISIITANQVLSNASANFNFIPVYVAESGKAFVGKELLFLSSYKDKEKLIKKCKEVTFQIGLPHLLLRKKNKFEFYKKIDCAILALHGLNGEDGTMQGVMELCHIPYTSPNVSASAVCMDKILMKDIMKHNGVPVVDYVGFDYDKNADLYNLTKNLTYPLIVKPANLGSSIGISMAENAQKLQTAVEIASNYDSRIIVENAITNLQEINIAVCRGDGEIKLSDIEYPKSWKEFLTFDEKYLSNKKSQKSQKPVKIEIDAKIEDAVKRLAKKCYELFNLDGFIRIDMMLDKTTNKLYVNEINTIPGSFSFYLWKTTFGSFSNQIDVMISQAIKKYEKINSHTFSYSSNVLNSNYSVRKK